MGIFGRRSSSPTVPLLAIVAPLDRVEIRPRLVKFVRVYAGLELLANHWAWRSGSSTSEVQRRFLIGGGEGGRWTRHLRYPLWSLAVFVEALRSKPDVILHCLGLESALPAVLSKPLRALLGRRTYVIFDDADRMSLSLPSRYRHLRRGLAWIERFTSRAVDLHIAPTPLRYLDFVPARRHEVHVLENTPDRASYAAAVAAKLPHIPPGEVYVYVTGRLTPDRGAAMIKRAAERLAPSGWCQFLVAGAGYDGPATELRSLPNVTDLGRLSVEQALALYRVASLVPAFYDVDHRPVNRYASSNKWGDCIAFGTHFVTNYGVVTAEPYLSSGLGHSIEYDDVDALVRLIESLRRVPTNAEKESEAGEGVSVPWIPFDEAAERILREELPEWVLCVAGSGENATSPDKVIKRNC